MKDKETNDPASYTITVTNDGNGTALAMIDGNEATMAIQDEVVNLSATANDGYTFKQWTVVGGGVILVDATINPTSFTMPAANVSIKAEFEVSFTDDNGSLSGYYSGPVVEVEVY